MQGDNPISWLMFFTLSAGAFIIAGAFIYFLRSRHSREIAANALQGDGGGRSMAPSGAGPELIGFAVIALAVMGLLATGYNRKPTNETAQMTAPIGGTTGPVGGTTTGMAQSPGTADRPKTYQPANPAPDTRATPTGSDTGVGPGNGDNPQPKQ